MEDFPSNKENRDHYGKVPVITPEMVREIEELLGEDFIREHSEYNPERVRGCLNGQAPGFTFGYMWKCIDLVGAQTEENAWETFKNQLRRKKREIEEDEAKLKNGRSFFRRLLTRFGL